MASRGCAFNCSFCTSPDIWEGTVRYRSPQNVVDEIELEVREHGIKYISFADDIFGLKKKWLREFCHLMIDRDLAINWMCNLHPLSFRNCREEMLDLMSRAGCDTVVLGLQSADPTILKNINRRDIEPEYAKELIELAKKRGMLTAMGYIFGLPGDTQRSIQNTIDYVWECKPHHAEFYKLSVLRGSQIDYQFPQRDMTELTDDSLNKLAKNSTRSFYLSWGTIWRNALYILSHRPQWLLSAIRNIPNLLTVTGLMKGKVYSHGPCGSAKESNSGRPSETSWI